VYGKELLRADISRHVLASFEKRGFRSVLGRFWMHLFHRKGPYCVWEANARRLWKPVVSDRKPRIPHGAENRVDQSFQPADNLVRDRYWVSQTHFASAGARRRLPANRPLPGKQYEGEPLARAL
jgi:hypothetical protein